MKHTKILAAVVTAAVTMSLVGCSGDDSGVFPALSDSASQTASNTSNSVTSGNASGNNSENISDSASSSNTSANSSSSTNDSDVSSPTTGGNDSKFVMPSIETLCLALPVEYKGPDKEYAAGTPGVETPAALDFVRAVGANIENAGSFVMTGEISGKSRNAEASGTSIPITEKYVYVVTDKASYLRVAHEQKRGKDGTVDFGILYEEYKVLNDDGTITTITKDGDKWVGVKSEEKLEAFMPEDKLADRQYCCNEYYLKYAELKDEGKYRPDLEYEYRGSDMYTNAIATFGPITFFNSKCPEKDPWGGKSGILDAKVERDNDGNLTFCYSYRNGETFLSGHPADGYDTDVGYYWPGGYDFMKYRVSNIQRYYISDSADETINAKWAKYGIGRRDDIAGYDGILFTPTYTVSNDNMLMSFTGKIGASYDVQTVFNFSNWGNIETINVPDYTLA